MDDEKKISNLSIFLIKSTVSGSKDVLRTELCTKPYRLTVVVDKDRAGGIARFFSHPSQYFTLGVAVGANGRGVKSPMQPCGRPPPEGIRQPTAGSARRRRLEL